MLQHPLNCFGCCRYHCHHYSMMLTMPLICCHWIFSQPYCGRSIHGSQIVCTCQMWPCTRYICRINGQVLRSYCALETRDLAISIGTSAINECIEIDEINEFSYIFRLFLCQLTLPQTGHRPASLPLLAASCIELVTKPCEPSKCRSRP